MEGLETRIGTLRMSTPLMAVSGIFGVEYSSVLPGLRGVGAIVAKSITLNPKPGNAEPRIIETPAGLLNSIGIQNPGVREFVREHLPKLLTLEVPIIVSVAGSSVQDYVECCSILSERDEIDAIELNVSCPNVDRGGMEFGCDPSILRKLVRAVKRVVREKTMIVKLTPNVTDIAVPAQAAIDSGADAISLINTLRGMAIDLNTCKPKLGNRIGGLSGQAIHPVAVYMVYRCYTECCRSRGIPIIGMGGVSCGDDAAELIVAGANAVGIGTAMFRGNYDMKSKKESIFEQAEKSLLEYVRDKNVPSIAALVGQVAENGD